MSSNVDVVNTILQNQLTDDASVVKNLPYIVASVSKRNLESSPHLARWLNRVNALLHSKDTGARWAGLCLALETSRSSVEILLSGGQGWVTIVLPLLSKLEIFATWTAAIRLLTFIFSSTTTFTEFHRQVTAPNVVKYTTALLSLIEKESDINFKCLCLDSISTILPLYPTLHRPLLANLSALILRLLDGSHLSPTPSRVIEAACRLYASLHTTGGKVGGSTLWRKNVDETIAFCTSALASLRSTYHYSHPPSYHANLDPFSATALYIDRLRCGIELLCKLLQAIVSRPVAVPIKALASLCNDLLKSCSQDEPREEIDLLARTAENLVVSQIISLGCDLLLALITCIRHRFAPYTCRSLSVIAFQLEQGNALPIHVRQTLVHVIISMFNEQFAPFDPLLVGRAIKSLLPVLSPLLSQKNDVNGSGRPLDGASKGGKKRARGFEGDEIFRVGSDVSIPSPEEGQVVLSTLRAFPALLRTPNIPEYLRSLTSKILLSLSIVLPERPHTNISSDPALKGQILSILNDVCIDTVADSTTVLNTNIALALGTISQNCVVNAQNSRKATIILDVLIHPRLPPLFRGQLPLDAAILGVESMEERATRENIGLSSRSAEPELSQMVSPSPASPTKERVPPVDDPAPRNGQVLEHLDKTSNHYCEPPKPVSQPVVQESVFNQAPNEQATPAKIIDVVAESNNFGETKDYFPPAPLTEARQSTRKVETSNDPASDRMDEDSDDEELPVLDPESDSGPE